MYVLCRGSGGAKIQDSDYERNRIPLDKNYYQTVKGMVAAIDILEPGGNLFIVSEYSEGMGSPEYAECQRRLIESVRRPLYETVFQKQRPNRRMETEMQLKAAKVGTIHL